ncbi:RidA family protein [Rothia aerolata]|uniref:LysR family transcriptional regulator n=1 Tax=Rothia aerolata TaxID=1812262 RepID=A0A917ISE7_9MICC|nr:RidA family protein [Rothia aerolata]GGH61288.1 LysR family transcriptional regulator [Rothia aerolata]
MSRIEERIIELGYRLPEAPAPVAAYVPAVTTGNYVFTSGQLPFVDGALPATGKVSESSAEGTVSPEDAKKYAAISLLNALAAAKQVLGDLDRVVKVVKVVGFVSSETSFFAQPAVINGASELLGEIFGEAGIHARSAVGVPVLPLDSPVEVELILEYA